MAAIESDDILEPQLAWAHDARQLLRQHATILETIRQLAGYRQELLAIDQLDWLGHEQESLTRELQQLVDEESGRLDSVCAEKLKSLTERQARLARTVREMTPSRHAVEEILARQTEAIRRSRELAEDLRHATVQYDIDQLRKAVRRVLEHGQITEDELSDAVDLSKPF